MRDRALRLALELLDGHIEMCRNLRTRLVESMSVDSFIRYARDRAWRSAPPTETVH